MTFVRTAVLLTFWLLAGTAAAQPLPSVARALSVEDALRLAETRSEQIAIARAGVTRASNEQVRARSERLPQLSATASYDRALASEFSGLFEGEPAGPPCAPFSADPQASIEQRIAELERAVDCGATGQAASPGFGDFEDLPFGRRNTYRINLAFSQNVFDAGRIGAQADIAGAGREAAEINLASTRAQLMLDVVRAYYDAALSARLVEIAEATYRQADATFAQTRLGFEAGSQPEFELLRAQVTRDNQRPVVIRAQAAREIALLRLKQMLDIPAREPIDLTTPLDSDTLPPPAGFAVTPASAVVDDEDGRAAVRQAQTIVRQREAAVTVARSQRLPTISVTSSFGQVAYPSGAFPGLDDFRRNWTVGAILQVPILNGGRLRAEEAIARADADESRARLQQARELALVDSQTAVEDLRSALAAWEASAGTVQQARRAYEIAELRYREGVSTQLELSDARLLLVQAEATRAQAARDVQVARAHVALLPDLPIGAGPGGAPAVPTGPGAQQPAQQPVTPPTRQAIVPASATATGAQAAGGIR
jgi:outer membrane protein TolC